MPAVGSVADTVLNDADQVAFNLAVKRNYDSAGLKKTTITAATDSATLTGAACLSGHIRGVPTGAASYALPTAANMVAAVTGASVGDSWDLVISNKSAGANTITVTAGGATLEGTATIAQNTARLLRFTLTNVTASSEAYTVVCVGA